MAPETPSAPLLSWGGGTAAPKPEGNGRFCREAGRRDICLESCSWLLMSRVPLSSVTKRQSPGPQQASLH